MVSTALEITLHHENSARLICKDVIRNYCMGGYAVVTLKSPSGVHYTYLIRDAVEELDSFSPDTRFVYVKTSTRLMNGNSWRYVGMIYNNGRSFRRTFHSFYPNDHKEFKGAKFIVRMMNEDFETPMELYHEGTCPRCGRRLTSPSSLEIGYGPKCYKAMKDEQNGYTEQFEISCDQQSD